MEIRLIQGDITKIEVDVIVNAANTSLLGGGGVDGAIHRAGGASILEACRKIRNKQGGCKVGEAVYTSAGDLPAKYVIHTVGPRWNDGKNEEIKRLKACYKNTLELAEHIGAHSLAFPNISTGIYKFPKDLAADIAIDIVRHFESRELQEIQFVCFDHENYGIYKKLLKI